MEEIFYQHHVTVSKWMGDFETLCQDHFTWLDEVLKVAAENYQKPEVEVLPKTPSVKKRIRKRKPPIVLSSEDDDFVEPLPPKKMHNRSKVMRKDDPDDESESLLMTSASMSMSTTSDDGDQSRSTSTRSTRSSRTNNSSRSTRSTKSTKSSRKKVTVSTTTTTSIDDDVDDNNDLRSLNMESISEEDETVKSENPQMPTVALFKIMEEPEVVVVDESTNSVSVEEWPEKENNQNDCNTSFDNSCKDSALIIECKKSTPKFLIKKTQSLTSTPITKTPCEKSEHVLSKELKHLKKALTPVSPKVHVERILIEDDSIKLEVDGQCLVYDSDDQDGSFAALNVKDKVKAYDNLINKLTPICRKNATTPPVYKSKLNITLSSERLPAKARVVQHLFNSPLTTSIRKRTSRQSSHRKSSIIVGRKSSLASQRKSLRLSQQAARLSKNDRKSFLMKNRAIVSLVNCDSLVKSTVTPIREEVTSIDDQKSIHESFTRKRQLATDSDSSLGTPEMAKKKVKAAQSPRVKQLKASVNKSSDSEYVTDDSDCPMSPGDSNQKRGKYNTHPRHPRTLLGQKMTPSGRSPMSGSFIQRNTPKAATLQERQEIYKKEFSQKRLAEERRLEKIKLQKREEVEKQKRRREERRQQVLTKRLAHQKAAMENSLSTVKSKEKRVSAVIKEQREKAEVERLRRNKKQAEVEERRRQEELRRLQKIREKGEEQKMVQAMMQRRKEYEEQERLHKLQEEKRLAEEKRQDDEKRVAEERKRESELQAQRQRHEAARQQTSHNTSLNSTMNKSMQDVYRNELQTYNIDNIRSDDETDDEDAPKKEIPPWASGRRIKATMIHQHYKPPIMEEIFPPLILLLPPDLSVIFPKQRPRFNKRTSSAVWSPINKHFLKNLA